MKTGRGKPLGALVLALALFGCAREEASRAEAVDKTSEILVGEYGSMTGPEASFGQGTHNGIILALDEINAGGGVKGRKIKVITEDDQSRPDQAASAVTKLISQHRVVAILGAAASSNSLAGAPICQSNKVPMITPGSTNPEVTKKGDYIFRTCFIDPYQGEALAKYIANDLKLRRAAILRDVSSDYSMGLANVFRQTFVSLGGEIVAEQSYSKGDSDFRAQLTGLKSSRMEVLFVPGYYTDIGQIAIQARDLGIQHPLMGGDGWDSPRLIEIGGEALEGSFYTNHHHADDPAPSVRNFVDKYRKRHGYDPDGGAALGYDSMKLLASAMRRAASLDGPTLRDEIARTREFAGVTGVITMGPDRNPLNKKFVVLEVKNGRLALRAAIEPLAGSADGSEQKSQ
ncbi:MAG TPA: ABC transporter substrate-binding protein [Thermoanaerobaculia bacterium]|nr:ABC transporter substrate-binding protein [Thermoanaerobaculia bacterium]